MTFFKTVSLLDSHLAKLNPPLVSGLERLLINFIPEDTVFTDVKRSSWYNFFIIFTTSSEKNFPNSLAVRSRVNANLALNQQRIVELSFYT